MLENIHDILHAWFGESDESIGSACQKWVKPDEQFIFGLKKRFEPLLEQVQLGELALWLEHATSTLAYILLYDQFPRLFYPNQAKALAYDQRARKATQHALEHELEKNLSCVEQSFLWMPLMHSENFNDQRRSVALYTKILEQALDNGASADCLVWLEHARTMALEHHEVILKFDRFPQNNHLLQRESTELELKFIELKQQ